MDLIEILSENFLSRKEVKFPCRHGVRVQYPSVNRTRPGLVAVLKRKPYPLVSLDFWHKLSLLDSGSSKIKLEENVFFFLQIETVHVCFMAVLLLPMPTNLQKTKVLGLFMLRTKLLMLQPELLQLLQDPFVLQTKLRLLRVLQLQQTTVLQRRL